jgi:hypothetical protein
MVSNPHKLELCGICRKPSPRHKGLVYYGTDDWLLHRLFICHSCEANLLIQRTHHELCYECIESFPEVYVEAGLIGELQNAFDEFEKAHASIFDRLPATTEEEPLYPGSLNADFEKWLEKNYPGRDNRKADK